MEPLLKENLITTKDAREISGYTSDYLSLLARSGKIRGERIGRNWIIDKASLTHFLETQGSHKITQSRILASERAKEYRTHRSLIHRAKKVLSTPSNVAEPLYALVTKNALRSQVLAVTTALFVVAGGMLVAGTPLVPQVAANIAATMHDAASGFNVAFGGLRENISNQIVTAQSAPRAESIRAVSSTAVHTTPTPLFTFDFSSLVVRPIEMMKASTLVASSLRATTPLITADDIQTFALDAYHTLSSPSRTESAFVDMYVGTGARAYTAIITAQAAYDSLIRELGVKTLALAATTRDMLALSPAFVTKVNLAFGNAIIDLTRAAIHADVVAAYSLATAAPESAHVAFSFISTMGDTLALATSRVPALATTLFLDTTAVPATVAPQLAQAAFTAEYAVALHFVPFAHAVADQYLALVEHTGQFAYAGTSGVQSLVLAVRAPQPLQLAAATGATDSIRFVGEKIALFVYATIDNLFTTTSRTLAALFAPAPSRVLPKSVPTNVVAVATSSASAPTPVSVPTPSIAVSGNVLQTVNTYPTYTTVTRGVSEETLSQSLASFRTDMLATMAGAIRPIAAQSVTNQTTIQQVNMIQDLSNLIVRNGDFRGGTLSNASAVSASSGSFTSLSGGTTTLGETAITGLLTVNGVPITSSGGGGNVATSTLETAGNLPYWTSTAGTPASLGSAANLNWDNAANLLTVTGNASTTQLTTTGATYLATAGGNVGIGTTSPAFTLDVNGIVNASSLYVNGAPYIGSQWTTTGSSIYYNTGNIGVGTTSPFAKLSVAGNGYFDGDITASNLTATGTVFAQTLSSTNITAINSTTTNATTTSLYTSGTFAGAGLVSSCVGSAGKLLWDATTKQFTCGVDAGSGGGLTGLGGQYSAYQTGSTQTLATTSDTNLGLTITSSGDIHTFTPSWIGQLGIARGGTGLSALSGNQILYANADGSALVQAATSTLSIGGNAGTVTNGVYTTTFDTLFDTRLSATTTLAGITTLPNLINSTTTNATTTNLYTSGTFAGAGLIEDCVGSAGKLLWASTTKQFTCGVDAGSGGGLTGLAGQYSSYQTGSTQTLATTSDTNLGLTITSSGDVHTFTPSWVGTLADARITSAATWNAKQDALSFTYPLVNSANVVSLAFGTTTSNTWAGTQVFTNTPTLAALTGLVAGNSGTLYQTASSTLFGTGTGGQVLAWNSGVPQWVASTTFSSGLLYTSGNVTNAGLLSLQQLGGGTAQTGAITFATSSQTTNGQTVGLNVTNSSGAFTFSPTLSGTLTIAGGGTGLSSLSGNQLLYSNADGSALIQTATSSLSIGGNAQTATTLQTARTINGISFDGSANIIIASTTLLADTNTWTNTQGMNISGNAATVTTNANLSGVITSVGNTTSYAATAGANTILANATGGAAAPTFISTSTLNIGGTASNITGIAAIANGGTGASSWTANSLLYSNANGSALAFAATSSLFGFTPISNALAKGNFIVGDDAGVAQATSSIFISSTGSVGVSSTSPWGLLSVSGNALTNGAPQFVVGSSSATNFVVANSGYVGVGTSTPTYNFTVNQATSTSPANAIAAFTGSGGVGAWKTSTSLATAVLWHSSVVANGYVYVLGGSIGSTPQTNVQFAKLNADGSVGSWASTTPLATAERFHTSVVANGYVYTIGGSSSGSNLVQYAKIQSDGTLSTWRTTSSLATGQVSHSTVVANGYVYVIGGTSNQTLVQYAKLNADGTLGAWQTSANSVPVYGEYNHTSVVAGGYVYVIGGNDSVTTATTSVSYAKLNSDGTTGAWASTASLATAQQLHTSVVANGYVYAMGGSNPSSNQAIVQYAKLNANGTLGAWQTATALTTGEDSATSVVANGYMYVIGGNSTTHNVVQYAPLQRVMINGNLDLLGLAGGSLNDANTNGSQGSTGGSIFAGNIFSNGNLEVTGNASLSGGLGVNGNFTLNATTSLAQNNAVFSLLTATATAPIFTAQYNGFIGMGTSTPQWNLQIAGTRPSFALTDTAAAAGQKHWLFSSMGGSLYIGTSTDAYATSTTAALTITNSGQVGIGTSTFANSSEKLSVLGSISNLIGSASPRTVSTPATGASPTSVYVSGRYAYVANNDGASLSIIDVSNPASPTTVSTPATSAYPLSVYVSGRYAYVTNNGGTLSIIDVSNPAAPVTVSTPATGANPSSVYVSGRYAYVTNNSGASLSIIDVSNPSAPVTVSTPATGASPTSVYVSGRYAYVTNNSGASLSIIDVSNPAAPVTVSTPTTGASPTSVYVSGRYAYVTNNGGTLSIIDVSNPSAPVTVSTPATGANPRSVYVSGRYAYVANYGGASLSIIDISNPASPTTVSTPATGANPYSVYVSGRYAYVANLSGSTLSIIDVSGIETTSALVHSLEAGNLQVRNDIIAQGQLQVSGGINAGIGGIFSQGAGSFTTFATTSRANTSALSAATLDNNTSSNADVLTVTHGNWATSTPGANGISTSILFAAGNTSATTTSIGRISSIFTAAGGTATTSALTFSTLSGYTLSEKMRLDNNGYLGIGTTSPTSLFSIGTAGNAFRVDTTGTVKEGIWNGTTIAIANGGTGVTSFTGNQVHYGNFATVATSSFANGTNITVTNGSTSYVLGNAPTISISGTIGVTNGGLGINSVGDGQLLFGSGGTTALTTLATTSLAGRFLSLDYTTGRPAWTATSSLFGFTPLSNALAKGNFIVGNDAGTAQATSSIFISSTGLVGIGTTSPFARLSVKGAGSTTGVNFQTTNSSDSPLFTILDSGNVGIGTTSPGAYLDVSPSPTVTGGSTSYGIRSNGIYTSNGGGNPDTVYGLVSSPTFTGPGGNNNGSNFVYGIYTAPSMSGSIGSSVANNVYGLYSAPVLSTGTAGSATYGIYVNPQSTIGTNYAAALMGGNVGIGTTSPFAKLSVAGSGVFTGGDVLASTLTATSSISTPSLTLSGVSINSLLSINASGVVVATSTPTFGNFNATSTVATSTISTGGLTVGGSQFVVQQTSGNVGIGTTNPRALLQLGTHSNSIPTNTNMWITGTKSLRFGADGDNADYGSFLTPGYGTNSKLTLGTRDGAADVNIMTLMSSNVGIGTTSPFAKLDVAGANNGTVPLLQLSSVASFATTTRFIVQNGGNIGIGTTSPTSLFSIGTAGNAFRVDTTGTVKEGVWNGTTIAVANGGTGQTSVADGALLFGSGGTTALTALATTSLAGRFLSLDYTTGRPAWTATSSLFGFTPLSNALAKGNFIVGDDAGTAQATSSIFISSTGNLGVGAAAPSYKLDVAGFINTDQYSGYKQAGNTVLYASTTNNTLAIGASSAAGWMSASSTQWYSVAVGPGALATTPINAAAQYNTAVGYNALYNNTGNSNSAFGGYALYNNTTGGSNSAFGTSALYNTTTGSSNSAIGVNTLYFNTTGSNNSVLGYGALFYNTSATNTVAMGYQAARGTATYNNRGGTYLGYQSGYSAGTGSDYNTLLGYQSGYNVTAGYGNVMLGSVLSTGGSNITTGYNNIMLGYNAGLGTTTSSSNFLNIGNSFFGTMIATSSATSLPTSFANVAFAIATSSFTGSTLTVQNSSSLNSVLGLYTAAGAPLLSISNTGTTTIQNNNAFAFSFATSTTATPIFSINTTSGQNATTSINGGLVVDGGALQYDSSTGVTSISSLAAGPSSFDTDAGIVSWIDMPTATTTAGLVNSYSAQMGGNPVLTLFGTTTTSGTITHGTVGVGTTTPAWALTVQGGLCLTSGVGCPATEVAGGAYFSNAVGIGSTSPWGLLSVNGNALGAAPQFVVGSSSATNFVVTNGGQVGVGTSTPGSLLSIQGIANFTTGTTTFYGAGINLAANQCYAVNGVCLSSATLPTGTAGQTLSYVGTTLTATSTLTILANGNIGIGTTTPQWLLNPYSATAAQLALSAGAGVSQWAFRNAGGNLYFATTTIDGTATTTTSALTILNNGYLGIGTSTPAYTLDIAGTARSYGLITPNIALSGSYGSIITAAVGSSTEYTNFSGGIGTGGADSIGGPFNNALRITHTGNLVNIGSIQGGELNLSSGGTFAAKVDYGSTGLNTYRVALGDLNGDGKSDLAVTNANSNTVSVLLNNGNGTFAAKVDYTTGATPIGVALGDVNGDGRADLAVTNNGGTSVSVFLNNGNGTFAAKVDYTTGASPWGITIGDVNGDGKVDLAVASAGAPGVSVLLNNGNGTFATKVDYTTGTSPRSVALSDLNGDGKADLVAANYTGTGVSVLLNNGNGTFAAKVDYTTGTNPQDVTLGDVNGDGKIDLAVTNNGSTNVSVLLNNGNGTFATKVDYATGSGPYGIALGDVNGDGRVDMIVANNTTSNVSVLLNQATSTWGGASFATKVDYTTGLGPFSIALGDMNGDGKADLAVANNTDTTVSILLNINKPMFYAQASTGNISVGTTSPWALVSIQGRLGSATPLFDIASTTSSAFATSSLFRVLANGNVGVGTSTPWGLLSINGNGLLNGAPQFVVGSSSATNFIVTSGGNIGIGTTSPNWKFSLVGDARIKTTTNSSTAFVVENAIGSSTLAVSTVDDSGNLFSVASSTGSSYFEITSSGDVGFGVTTPTLGPLEMASGAYVSSGGTWTNASDMNLKENFVAQDPQAILSKIATLPVTQWNYINETASTMHIGPVAQDFYAAFGLGGVHGDTSISTIDPSGVAFLGIQALDTRTKFISNAATSTVLTVDSAGRVGIGTTTPAHTLDVAGDVAAIAFVNTSTKSSKKDINYATASSNEEMLQQLLDLRVATYHYKIESQNAPLRLGFIAEDAQTVAPEILSFDGKGVDLYKLATFTLSGVQALAAKFALQETRLTSLEARMAALESGAVGMATTSVSAEVGSLLNLSTTSLASALNAFGVFIQKGFVQFGTLIADRFVAATDATGASSAGTMTILTGTTTAQVMNVYVKPTTKVLVTFNSPITGNWWVADKTEGSFRVMLSAPQATDISFDYFLVQTEGQIATSTPAVSEQQAPSTPDTSDTATTTTESLGGSTATSDVAVEPPLAATTTPIVIETVAPETPPADPAPAEVPPAEVAPAADPAPADATEPVVITDVPAAAEPPPADPAPAPAI